MTQNSRPKIGLNATIVFTAFPIGLLLLWGLGFSGSPLVWILLPTLLTTSLFLLTSIEASLATIADAQVRLYRRSK